MVTNCVFWAPEQKEWVFTYYDTSSNVRLSVGSDQGGMKLIVDGVICSISSILSSSDFTSTMKRFCLVWASSNGLVAIYFNGDYQFKSCSLSTGRTVPGGGQLRLGGESGFKS